MANAPAPRPVHRAEEEAFRVEGFWVGLRDFVVRVEGFWAFNLGGLVLGCRGSGCMGGLSVSSLGLRGWVRGFWSRRTLPR